MFLTISTSIWSWTIMRPKTPAIRKCLVGHPRWHTHFTPTAASWINQMQRFFADLTERQIQRGVHRSTSDLEA
jgi:putative transposase